MGDHGRSYIVVVRSLVDDGGLDAVEQALESAGVELDRSFSPVPLPSDHPAVLLRGVATGAAVERAKAAADVEFFPDLNIGPS